MGNDLVSLKKIKKLIEELREEDVSRETIDKVFEIYHNGIIKSHIDPTEKAYLCVMNGLAYKKIGSYLPAESSYLSAQTFARESQNEKLQIEIGYEIVFFVANSKEWSMDNRQSFLRRVFEIGFL